MKRLKIFAKGVALGGLVGVAAGLLSAQKKGKEYQKDAKKFLEKAVKKGKEIQKKAKPILKKVKKESEKAVKKARKAVKKYKK